MANEEAKEKKEQSESRGASGSQTPPDPAVKAAQDAAALAKAQAEKAKAEKEIAESQRDKMKAELMPVAPSDKTTAPNGDVTTDSAGFIETQILGQEASRKIATLLAADLKVHAKLKTLVIYNAADIAVLTSYGVALQELKEFVREFEAKHQNAEEYIKAAKDVLNEPDFEPPAEAAADFLMAAIAAPAIATGVVKSVAELVNLFRPATDIKNKTLSGSDDLVLSYLVKKLCRPQPPGNINAAVYSPALFPPLLLNSAEETELVETLKAIWEGRFTAREDLKKTDSITAQIFAASSEAQSTLDKNNKAITGREDELGKLAPNDSKRPELEAVLQELRDEKRILEKRINKFAKTASDLSELKSALQFVTSSAEHLLGGLETPDAATKQTPLSKLLAAAHLQKILNDVETFTIRFTVSANGTTKIKKNFFWNASVRHSASASLAYQLFDRTGRIVRANAFQWYFDWQSSEEISRMRREDQ